MHDTLWEAMRQADKEMIDECTRKIRAAGISEKEEARILSRGYNHKPSHMNQDRDAAQVAIIFLACGALLLFGALLGIGIVWLIGMIIS